MAKTLTNTTIDSITISTDPEDQTLNMLVTFIGYEEDTKQDEKTWRRHVNAIVAKVRELLRV